MANKIKINLNGKTYNIDESALADASATLKHHLTNVMNGEGAAMQFGGVALSFCM